MRATIEFIPLPGHGELCDQCKNQLPLDSGQFPCSETLFHSHASYGQLLNWPRNEKGGLVDAILATDNPDEGCTSFKHRKFKESEKSHFPPVMSMIIRRVKSKGVIE